MHRGKILHIAGLGLFTGGRELSTNFADFQQQIVIFMIKCPVRERPVHKARPGNQCRTRPCEFLMSTASRRLPRSSCIAASLISSNLPGRGAHVPSEPQWGDICALALLSYYLVDSLDTTVADAALRVGVESRRSFARWIVFFMLLLYLVLQVSFHDFNRFPLMFYEFSCSSGVIVTALILTAWGQHDLNNLAYKT